jgi:hypothetical protein
MASGGKDASAASRKPAISSTDSPLMRMASSRPPISRSDTRPSSMAVYKVLASTRDMLRAPFTPRPTSLMKGAARNGSSGGVKSVCMAEAYHLTGVFFHWKMRVVLISNTLVFPRKIFAEP